MSAREIRLPALSATMESATLLAWKVGAGDQIIEGQAIAEVSTDKVDMDLEAPFSGQVLTLAVEPGDEIALARYLPRSNPRPPTCWKASTWLRRRTSLPR